MTLTDRSARALADLPPYAHLIGADDARDHLPTPSLLIDVDALDRNIERMARFAREAGVALRPHVKTHKCIEIARRQIAAGAIGVCCATLEEMEVMAAAGVPGILLTSALSTTDKLMRFIDVLRIAPDAMIVVDHPQTVRALAHYAREAGARRDAPVGVMIDVDIGFHRSGARTAAQIDAVVQAVLEAPELALRGIQAYSGAVQHIVDRHARASIVREQEASVRTLAAGLGTRLGHRLIVSGGGTGTHRIEVAEGVLSELQVGSYVFMDADYARVDLGLDGDDAFETALLLRASVTGVNCAADFADSFVTIDAGTKSFALNGPLPRCTSSPWHDTGFRFMGDEHGHVLLAGAASLPPLGHGLEFQVSHCDPTVHHFDHFYVVRERALIDIWAVDARGRR